VATPLDYGDGHLRRTASGPGLGVLLDEDKLSFYHRDREANRPALMVVN
jgi:hypothetical protein